MRRVLLFALLPLVALAAPGHAQDQAQAKQINNRLQEIESSIDADREATVQLQSREQVLAGELAEIREQMVTTANAARQHETAMSSLEQELAALAEEETAKLAALAERRQELSGTLAALQRIALRPQAALLVTPGDPNDVVRSGLLLRTAIPRIESRAQELKQQVAALNQIRADITARRQDLDAAAEALSRERFQLTALANQKASLLQQTRDSRDAALARIEQLTREAVSLEELLAKLAAERVEQRRLELEREREALERADQLARATPASRPGEAQRQSADPAPPPPAATSAPPGSPSIAAARGSLTPPAAGQIVIDYQATNDFGSKSNGVTYQTRPSALVVAPWDGQVAFAGPFRTFGRILIIDHGEGYHSLLAGMGRIDAPVGQWVLAGEPVGITGGEDGATTDKTEEQSRLYVELRRDGQPINPLPWLAASTTR